jgi:hypothetical protein
MEVSGIARFDLVVFSFLVGRDADVFFAPSRPSMRNSGVNFRGFVSLSLLLSLSSWLDTRFEFPLWPHSLTRLPFLTRLQVRYMDDFFATGIKLFSIQSSMTLDLPLGSKPERTPQASTLPYCLPSLGPGRARLNLVAFFFLVGCAELVEVFFAPSSLPSLGSGRARFVGFRKS